MESKTLTIDIPSFWPLRSKMHFQKPKSAQMINIKKGFNVKYFAVSLAKFKTFKDCWCVSSRHKLRKLWTWHMASKNNLLHHTSTRMKYLRSNSSFLLMISYLVFSLELFSFSKNSELFARDGLLTETSNKWRLAKRLNGKAKQRLRFIDCCPHST